jgi:hypothetical protein
LTQRNNAIKSRLTIIADYIVYDVWIFVELLTVYFLFPETGNMTLEQTAAHLDGIDVKGAVIKGLEEEKSKTTTTTVDLGRDKGSLA